MGTQVHLVHLIYIDWWRERLSSSREVHLHSGDGCSPIDMVRLEDLRSASNRLRRCKETFEWGIGSHDGILQAACFRYQLSVRKFHRCGQVNVVVDAAIECAGRLDRLNVEGVVRIARKPGVRAVAWLE